VSSRGVQRNSKSKTVQESEAPPGRDPVEWANEEIALTAKRLAEAERAMEAAFEAAKKEGNSAELLRFVRYFEARQKAAVKELRRAQDSMAAGSHGRSYSLLSRAAGPLGAKEADQESKPATTEGVPAFRVH